MHQSTSIRRPIACKVSQYSVVARLVFRRFNVRLVQTTVKLSNMDTLGPIKCVLIREVSSFQGANNIYFRDLVNCSD